MTKTDAELRKLEFKRGDIVYINLHKDKDGSSVQDGNRPCLIVSNNASNKFAPFLTVVPLTTRQKKNIPTHVNLKRDDVHVGDKFKLNESTLLCEQVMAVDKANITDTRVAHAKPCLIAKVNEKLKVQLGL